VTFITIKLSLLRETGLIQIWASLNPLQLWIFLTGLKLLVLAFLFRINFQYERPRLNPIAQLAWLITTATATVLILSLAWIKIFRGDITIIISGPAGKFALLSLWFIAWNTLRNQKKEWAEKHSLFFISTSIWLITFLLSAQLAQWMNSFNTPFKNYWNWLADAFLHGRLYLIDPPSIGDMTYHAGRLYIPIPPLPAIIITPFVAIWGQDGFNTTLFSVILSSGVSALLFLCLEELRQLSWIKLSRSGIFWMVALFSFGTVELWLSISSVVWYFSQICTIFFVALSFFFAIKKYPSWLTGIALAMAVMGRPNVFVLWPALVGITLSLQETHADGFSLKRMTRWAAWSALPVVISVWLLLYYNFLRFGSFLDFGYVNINGSMYVMENVKKYGMFNPHFIPSNFNAMFLSIPAILEKCKYFFPRGNGLSLIFSSPALIYAIRRFKFSWWLQGCWISILLSLGMLLMYHNNGAVQIAYRYVMDFLIPLILVMSFSAGNRISVALKTLIILSIVINYYAVVSWYFGAC